MTKHLGAVIAIQADTSRATARRLAEAQQATKVPNLLEGLVGTYQPATEDGEELPEERQRVQATIEEMLAASRAALGELFDATAARDYTNASGAAVADVVVGDQVLIEAAPVPYVLFLDRQLDELQGIVNRIPTLSPSTEWTLVEARGVYGSTPIRTVRQVQQHKVVTLAPATERHPAQAQVVAEAVAAGTWTRVKFSGAAPVDRRETILQRIATLRAALHTARDEANRAEALQPVVGERVLSYLFD